MKLAPDFRYSRTLQGARTLELRGGISEKMLRAILPIQYERVILLPGEWSNLEFLLEKVDKISELIIRTTCDWRAVGKMTNLQRLAIGGPFSAPLDFSKLSVLEELDTIWNKGYERSIYTLPKLRKLKIIGWKEKNCRMLCSLERLESLQLVQGSCTSLDGLAELLKLREVHLHGMAKLVDIADLSGAARLAELRVQKIKNIRSWNVLSDLRALSKLELTEVGTLDSVKFVKWLDQLRYFRLGSTKVTDGDLLAVCDAPSLQQCLFKNFSHYNTTQEDVARYLDEKFPEEAQKRQRDERQRTAENVVLDRALYEASYGKSRDRWWSEMV